VYPARAVEVDAGVVGGVAQSGRQTVDAVLHVAVGHERANDSESAKIKVKFKLFISNESF